MDQRFHANGNKQNIIVVMGAIYVGIGRDFWIDVGLAKKTIASVRFEGWLGTRGAWGKLLMFQ